jgi:predicted transposase/invertase (TIGR01784 family)
MEALMGANRKYKDSVFSFLFSDPDTLRELYGAIEGVTLPPDVPVTINTLEGVLFADRINDISCDIGGKLVILLEHQSTINPNMPLRLLMYIARIYEKIVADRKIYTIEKVPIPLPEFFILYNGTAPYPDRQTVRLSDSFTDAASLGIDKTETPDLELTARVININQGRNGAIVRRCKRLNEYSAFIAKARDFEKQLGNRTEAMKQAVKYCREHDILKEFLEEHGSEVMNMLMTEWNWDEALAVRFEDGEKKGREEVVKNALAKGLPVETISGITGLSIEDIEQLAEE